MSDRPGFCKGTYCENCRNKAGGKPFREMMLKVLKLPADQVDFECPFGKPWGESLTEIQMLERQGLTPETAAGDAKRRSCCSPPPKP